MNKILILWRFMKGNRQTYCWAIAFIALGTLFSYAIPLVVRITIDCIIGDQAYPEFLNDYLSGFSLASLKNQLWIVTLIVLGLAILQGGFWYLRGKYAAKASEATIANLRDQLYEHLQHLPFSYYSTRDTGDLLQRCTSDVDTIRNFLAVQFVEIGRVVIMLGFAIAIMSQLSIPMMLVSMITIPITITFAFVFFVKIQNAFRQADESEAEMSTVLQENLTAVRVVKAFAQQDFEITKFSEKNVAYRERAFKVIHLIAYYWAISDLLCLSQMAAVLIVGSSWVIAGKFTLGTLVVFMTYEAMLLWPVRHLGRILTELGKAFVAIERIQEILQSPVENSFDGVGQSLQGDIKFSRVYFAYEKDKYVLQDVSFTVKPGQTVAILGATGAGKSTLVKLLPRLYEQQQGTITIDGVDIREFDRKWLRRQISIVLQEPFLYSKSLYDNIAFGNATARSEDVYSSAKIAAVHDVILGFEKGYQTVVGERGVTLSGGQKQRVAISRSIVRNPAILIFDDSLSAVDTQTEAKILGALRKNKQRATTFIIAHRLSTVVDADLILVLDHGKIIQQGTHHELLQQPGMYQSLWNMQCGEKLPQAV